MQSNKRRLEPPFLLVAGITGFAGVVAQVLLLREMLVSFLGNEFIWSLILANWVILEAAGVFIFGKIIDDRRNYANLFITLQMMFSLFLLFSIFLTRSFKSVLGFGFGENIGLLLVFLSSLLLIFPVSFCHGALFSLLCKMADNVEKVYAWEIIGSACSGILVTFLFVPYFSCFEIAFGVAFINFALCFFFFFQVRSFLKYVFLFSLFFLIVFSSFGGTKILEDVSLEQRWGSQQVLESQSSVYGDITVTTRNKQLTVFYNGTPSILSPYPDMAFIQDFVHLPLLFQVNPKRLLVLGSGAGGVIHEALKHPLQRIDYAELDPLILKVLKKHASALINKELNDPRVKISNIDGHRFLRKTNDEYDVILIGLSRPADLSSNRFFTQDFFVIAKRHLSKNGILAFTLPGSPTYIGTDLRDLNACILAGLRNVFAFIKVIPGGYNLFLASDHRGIMELTPDSILHRLEQREVRTDIISLNYLKHRLDSEKQLWFLKSLKDHTKKINRDFEPFAVFINVLIWNRKMGGMLVEVLEIAKTIKPGIIAWFLILLTTGFILGWRKKPDRLRLGIVYCIFTTGFFGMLTNIVLIFVFQVFYGVIYSHIGLLISSFMAGVAMGSFWINRFANAYKNDMRLFISLEYGVVISISILTFVLFQADKSLIGSFWFIIPAIFIPGVLVGTEFALSSRIFLQNNQRIGQTVGLLYSADLSGTWLAGIIGGVIFLPVLGFFYTCLLTVMLKLSSLLILIIFKYRGAVAQQ